MSSKIFHFLITFSTLCFMWGCSSYDEPETVDSSGLSEITEVYDSYQARLKSQLGNIVSELAGKESRSVETAVSGGEFINYLISIPVDELDSLYHKYCTPEVEVLFDKRMELVTRVLSENATADEISYIYNFADEYYSIGGQDLSFVENAVKNQTPFIRNCMIRFAVCADEFVSNNSRGIEECNMNMNLAIFKYVLEDAVTAEMTSGLVTTPAGDIASLLVDLGLGTIEAMKIAYDYDLCRRMHGVIVM